MCKQEDADFCSELGKDASSWSLYAPLKKPEWIQESNDTKVVSGSVLE
jgi:hypothetical protein